MTDGTSQGLFIVVAIVIFGIFVALSYTVFGSDGLSGGLSSLFEQSIHKTERSLERYKPVSFSIETFNFGGSDFEVHSLTNNSIDYTSDGMGTYGNGLSIQPGFTDYDMEYKLSFDIQVIYGSIHRVGGHFHLSEKQDMYVNGVKQYGHWGQGVALPDNTNKHHVEMYFNSEHLVILEDGRHMGSFTSGSTLLTGRLDIATNRVAPLSERSEHRVVISNIKLSGRSIEDGGF